VVDSSIRSLLLLHLFAQVMRTMGAPLKSASTQRMAISRARSGFVANWLPACARSFSILNVGGGSRGRPN
jgi:hypothetical protein